MAMPSTSKKQADFMDEEFTPTPVVVADLTIDLGSQIQKGNNKLTPNEDPEVKADRDVQDRHGGIAPPPTPGAAVGPTKNTDRQRSTTLTNTASGGGGAQDSTSTRCALGTSSRVLRMLTESGDVIRYVFLLSAGVRPFILDIGGGGRPVFSS